METTSIKSIETTLNNVLGSLNSFREYHKSQGVDMDTCCYGNESEYNLKSIIGGVKNILTDMGFLVRSHNLFLKLSSYSERNEILKQLQNLNNSLSNKQIQGVIDNLDSIKTRLRTYNLRTDRSRYVDYNDALDTLGRKAISLEDSIQDVKKKLEDSRNIYKEIQESKSEYDEIIKELSDKKNEFVAEFNAFTNEVGEFRALAEKAKSNEQTISNYLDQAKKDKDIFNEFVELIDSREKTLEKQNDATIEYEKKLVAFDQEQQEKLSDAEDLIKKARQSLQYTTAAGMSAAFQEQYDKTNNNWAKWRWLIAAAFFLAITIFIGVWIVTGWGIKGDNSTQLFSLIGRMSMVPFTILAAIFCANQYVKQKNLAEDYAYKAVLTKSIVAFSEELREKDEKGYVEYISTVLKEIHQDPLRKRGKEKDEITLKETTGILGKALDIIQSFSQKL